jgi:hypothetical protein
MTDRHRTRSGEDAMDSRRSAHSRLERTRRRVIGAFAVWFGICIVAATLITGDLSVTILTICMFGLALFFGWWWSRWLVR